MYNKENIPNYITFFRILIVPYFVYLLVIPSDSNRDIALFLFITASFTDWLDGFLARKMKVESNFGKLWDPLADKILVMAAMVMLADAGLMSGYIVVCLLAREMIVNGIRAIAAVDGQVISASDWAKHKTSWTMLGIALTIMPNTPVFFASSISTQFLAQFSILIALFLSVATGLDYFFKSRNLFSK